MQIAELWQRLGGLPHPMEAQVIWRGLWYEEAHHSTAIEGNTLVLKQVEALLEQGRAVGNEELAEYMEVKGLDQQSALAKTLSTSALATIARVDTSSLMQPLLDQQSSLASALNASFATIDMSPMMKPLLDQQVTLLAATFALSHTERSVEIR